jgi:type IVB pilus formation R64 PilN family outer membrane protein
MIGRYLCATSLLVLSACANQQLADQKAVQIDAALHQNTRTADDLAHPQKRSPIRPSTNVYLGSIHSSDDHGDPLPASVETAKGMQLSQAGRYTLAQLAEKIRIFAHLSVVVVDPSKADTTQQPAPRQAGAAVAGIGDPSIEVINQLLGGGMAGFEGSSSRAVGVQTLSTYQGPMSDFLNREIPNYGGDWQFHAGVLYLSRDVVRVYRITDIASETTSSTGLDGGSATSGSSGGASTTPTSGGSSGGSAGGGQTTTTKYTTKIWDDIVATVNFLAGAANVVASKTEGTLAVKCPLYCQEQVKSYISTHNRDVNRSILVAVTVLNIQRSGQDNYGFDPTLLYQNLPHGYSFSVLGQALPTPANGASPGTFTAGVINAPAGSSAAKFNGSSLAVQAVTQQGHVTGQFSKYVLVGNNRLVAKREATVFPYLSGAANNLASSGIASTSTNVVTQVIGDQLQVAGRLTDAGFIRLQLSLSRTNILQLFNFDLGGGITSAVPETSDDSNSALEFTVRDGSTVILSDVSNATSTVNNQGAGSVYNWLLGGSAAAQNAHDQTVLIVTAREWHPGNLDPAFTADAQ